MKCLLLFKFSWVTISVKLSAIEASVYDPSSFALFVNILWFPFFFFLSFLPFYLFSVVLVTEPVSRGSGFCVVRSWASDPFWRVRSLLTLLSVDSLHLLGKAFDGGFNVNFCPLRNYTETSDIFCRSCGIQRQFLDALSLGQNQTGNSQWEVLGVAGSSSPCMSWRLC